MGSSGDVFAFPSDIVLGSASPSRAALLASAGLEFRIEPAGVDEAAIRAALEGGQGGVPAVDVAEILARAKAEDVSSRNGSALVIGADQVLALGDTIFEKPQDMEAARRTLLALAGETHQLHSAVVLARGGDVVWAHTATASLTMRKLTPAHVGQYLAAAGDAVLSSVGAYQLESLGINLFEKIDGDYFTILGLPLLVLLERLRQEGTAP